MRSCCAASIALLLAFAAPSVYAESPAIRGLDTSVPPMRALIERYSADQATLGSVYTDSNSPSTRERWAAFYRDNRARL